MYFYFVCVVIPRWRPGLSGTANKSFNKHLTSSWQLLS